MKFDRKTVDMLISMDDEKLVGFLTFLAAAKGLTRESGIKPETARRLKEVMRSLTDADVDRISELIDIYKKSGR